MARVLLTPYEMVLIVYQDRKEEKRTVQYNALWAKLPAYYRHKLSLMVVKGLGVNQMMPLRSCAVECHRKESVWRIVEYYLIRWGCDESYRYIKQCYNLEDLRVQSCISIRKLVVLVLAVPYFASVYLGQSIKLKIVPW